MRIVSYILHLGSGMVGLVHDNAKLPNIEQTGMLLAPGRHHKLGYKKKTDSFLSAPYTSCNDKVTLGMQLMFDLYNGTNYGYSQLECFIPCIQAYT